MFFEVSEYLAALKRSISFEARDAIVRELELFAALVAVVLIIFVVRLVLHSRDLPRCWNCGKDGVRSALSHSRLDDVSRFVMLYPYRCDRCQMRFYCFDAHRHSAKSSSANRLTT